LVVTVSLLAPDQKSWPVWSSALVLASVLACQNYEPAKLVNWAGVSTPYGALGHRSPTEQYDIAADAWHRALATDADVVLFPEGLGGTWTPSSANLWALEAEERDALWIVGAMRRDREGQRNGVGVVGDGEPYFWPQRLPAPIGMWAPWAAWHVKSDLLRPSVQVIQGRRAALLMCFEQFVGWPPLQSALEGAEVALAPANLWFARGTNLNAVREVTLQSWARLMGWTVVEAING
jgi:predicted amidohydrolase